MVSHSWLSPDFPPESFSPPHVGVASMFFWSSLLPYLLPTSVFSQGPAPVSLLLVACSGHLRQLIPVLVEACPKLLDIPLHWHSFFSFFNIFY